MENFHCMPDGEQPKLKIKNDSVDSLTNGVDTDQQVGNIEVKTVSILELLGEFSDHLKEYYDIVVPERAFVTFLE